VNAETTSLLERPYAEIVDDLLTALVGGVVNEPIFFDVKEDRYALSRPASDVRGVTGTRTVSVNGSLQPQRYEFQKDVDFVFSPGDNSVVWLPEGVKPDDETLFYVDYFQPGRHSVLTDQNVGSVTRTVCEAIGREIATVYEQIRLAYLAGFIDTAEGKSLDLVVSILGVRRKTKEFAVGLATFFRDPAEQGTIAIQEGTVLGTAKGEVTFQTVEPRTLQRGQARIDVPIRATDAFRGDAGKVEAGKINTPAQIIAGISRVTNFEATFLSAEDETDIQLRTRAKAALRGLGKATLDALRRVIREGRGEIVGEWDPSFAPARRSDPGTVVLLIKSEPERFTSLRGTIEETRAAGVQVSLLANFVFLKPRLVVEVDKDKGLTPEGKDKVVRELIDAMQAYVDSLSADDPVEGAELLKALKAVKDVSKVEIADLITWRSDTTPAGLESVVGALAAAIAAVPPGDEAALRDALGRVLAEAAPVVPSGRRIPDRSLVQGPSGQRATDEEIEKGDFKVVPVVDGQTGWVFLDVEPADIFLRES
jgi:hypothetical protein